eukprot:COSAG01_NODE_5044_length_4528_cov_3.407541_5_plen_129_part_00
MMGLNFCVLLRWSKLLKKWGLPLRRLVVLSIKSGSRPIAESCHYECSLWGGTTTDDGEDVAWNKVRIELQKLIDGEDKSKPYSDEEIMQLLKNQGFAVARRTVSKYREKLSIPSSRQRRDWSKKKKDK